VNPGTRAHRQHVEEIPRPVDLSAAELFDPELDLAGQRAEDPSPEQGSRQQRPALPGSGKHGTLDDLVDRTANAGPVLRRHQRRRQMPVDEVVPGVRPLARAVELQLDQTGELLGASRDVRRKESTGRATEGDLQRPGPERPTPRMKEVRVLLEQAVRIRQYLLRGLGLGDT